MANGVTKPVERWKHQVTEAEIRQHFTGYSVSSIKGWYRNAKDGKEFRDRNLRFEIDLAITPAIKRFLHEWKEVLQRRFDQEEIYMRLSSPITWI